MSNWQLDSPLADYLAATPEIDWKHPSISAVVTQWDGLGEVARAKAAFEFVRDEVPHSWDAQDSRVTCAATEVLACRTGICYAKSHLLAAFLRAMGIPAGMMYQRLTLFDEPEDGHCIHALNATYLQGNWVRMDARGNKSGVDAQFSLTDERLAFAIRPEKGEIDYGVVHARPHPAILQCLRSNDNMLEIYRLGLPESL